MNGPWLLLIGCAAAAVGLLLAVFRDGPAFHDRLASFDEHVDTVPVPIIDDRHLTEEQFAARWVEITSAWAPGSAA